MRRCIGFILALVMVITMVPLHTAAANSEFDINDDGVLTAYNGTSSDIEIPDGVLEIGPYAFCNCSFLEKITLPNTLTKIGHYAFYGCTSLLKIDIPENVDSIDTSAFSHCEKLQQVNLKEGLHVIGMTALAACGSLKSILIPSSVEEIGFRAFSSDYALEEYRVAEGSQFFRSIDGVLFDASGKKLISYPCGKTGEYSVPNGVTELGLESFYQCTKLTQISIPDTVKTIYLPEFSSCLNLTSINVDPVNQFFQSVDGVLYDKDLKNLISYPAGASDNCVIPKGVCTISRDAFSLDSSLTKLYLPASIQTVEQGAFLDCDGLTDVYYEGDPDQWKAIQFELGNEILSREEIPIHYSEYILPDDPIGNNELKASLASTSNPTIEVNLVGKICGSIVVSFYDAVGQMKELQVKPAEITTSISYDSTESTDYAKVMWVDEDWKPITDAVQLSINKEESEADKYYGTNSQIVRMINANTSDDLLSEADVCSLLEERGFGDYPATHYYSISGEYHEAASVSDDSATKHPMYQTFFFAENGDSWLIYVINGKVYANPISFNLESSLSAELLVSESESLTSYDNDTNTFYVTLPKDTGAIVEQVDRIDAETLNRLTVEEIAGRQGMALPTLQEEDTKSEEEMDAVSLQGNFSPEPSAVLTESTNDDPIIVVSLGDSYSSGEGIPPFYGENTDLSTQVSDFDWLAHRSKASWPSLLEIPGVDGTLSQYHVPFGEEGTRPVQWYFWAVSGATTEHFQKPNPDDFKDHRQLKEYAKLYYSPIWGTMIKNGKERMPYQLDVFDKIKGSVDYVTLTIGGNDVDFSEVITLCVTESSYLDFNINPVKQLLTDGRALRAKLDTLRKNMNNTIENIRNVYKAIQSKAGDQAAIIVAGYPQLLDKNGKGTAISVEEATLVNENVTYFNRNLNSLVASCQKEGMNIHFVNVEDRFNEDGGHQAYSDHAWIHKIELIPKPQDIKDEPPSAFSIHPTEIGAAEGYAKCVNQTIQSLKNLSGVVTTNGTNTTDKHPLENVQINLISLEIINGTAMKRSVTSDKDGKFEIRTLPPGSYKLSFLKDGYESETKEITIGDDLEYHIKVELQKKPDPVSPQMPKEYLSQYIGMRVNDFVSFWGIDYSVQDNGMFYYLDNRVVGVFCPDSVSAGGNNDGSQFIQSIGLIPSTHPEVSVAPGLSSEVTLTDLEASSYHCDTHLLSEDETDTDSVHSCTVALGNDIMIDYCWPYDYANNRFPDPYTTIANSVYIYKEGSSFSPSGPTIDPGNVQVGSYVTFGHYEQDNDLTNGKEPISWRVLAKENGKALLISEYCLDYQPYNTDYTDVTWETCTLRQWVNHDFYDAAFDSGERMKIAMTTVAAEDNSYHGTDAGDDTQDKIFLLSIDEAQKYFKDDEVDKDGWIINKDRACKPTAYAIAQGCRICEDPGKWDDGDCWWRLRSPGYNQRSSAEVMFNGDISGNGSSVVNSDGVAVRLALWIDLSP